MYVCVLFVREIKTISQNCLLMILISSSCLHHLHIGEDSRPIKDKRLLEEIENKIH